METDVNTDEIQEESVETESSSAARYEPIEEDGFVSTLEFKEVEQEDADSGGDTPEKQGEPDSENKDSKGPVPYDRFQEVINQKNEERKAREALEQRLARLEQKPAEKKQEQPKSKYKYQNIMGMDDETIVDQFTNSPKTFLANFAQQVAHELTLDFQREQQAKAQQYQQHTDQQRTMQTMQSFFQDKEDGITMLQDGTIQKYMQENPGHNPISAYHALAGEQHFQAKLETELKKEKEKLLKQLKAAGKAAPVRGETASRSYADRSPTQAKNKAELKQSMLKRVLDSQ